MTLRHKLFAAISATFVLILVGLVAVTLMIESGRVERAVLFYDSAEEFAAGEANSFPLEKPTDSLLLDEDDGLHRSLTSLAVYRKDASGTPRLSHLAWGEIAEDVAVRRRALPHVREALETGTGARDGRSVVVPGPRWRTGAATDDEGRPTAVYLEMRPLDIDPVAASRITFLVIVAAWALLLVVVFLWLNRLVDRPLREILAGARRVAEGDYSQPVPVREADDEMHTVIDAFNSMMDELATLHEGMQERIGEALRRERRTRESLVIAQRLAATGTLAAGIAHEVNNPLGGMLNAVHSLKTKDMHPERREAYFELVEEGLQRIQATVAKILAFTPHKVSPQALDLSDVVEPALALVGHRVQRMGVVLDVERPTEPAMVFGDVYELQQALLNVLINALDALEESEPERPTVAVSTTVAHDEVRLEVRDNGPGMAAEDVSRAFDLFFTTKEQGKGSGLGLATVHKILDDHGGRVDLRADDGGGMQVRFVLPRLRE